MTLTDAVVYNSVLIVLGAWSKACRTGFVGGAGALMGWAMEGGREEGGRCSKVWSSSWRRPSAPSRGTSNRSKIFDG
jgi:hypothetical protein